MAEKKINKEELVDGTVNTETGEISPEISKKQPDGTTGKSTDDVPTGNEKQKKKKASFTDLIDGSILTREYVLEQMPFIFFLTFLAMVYIANKYDSEKIVRDTVAIKNELKELRCEKISIHSELDSISKQSSVVQLIKEKNMEIKQLVEPPKKIVINNDVTKQKSLASNK